MNNNQVISGVLNESEFNDYSLPTHYCRLMDWIHEDRQRLLMFCGYSSRQLLNWLGRTRQEQVNLIAQAIKEDVLP